MENESRNENVWLNTNRQMLLAFTALALLIGIGVWVFLGYYQQYNNELLYAERLSQMQEVTGQLFSGLEDIVDVQWDKARYQCRYIEDAAPETVEELTALLDKQARLSEIGEGSEIIAFDTQGRYYTQAGKQGMIEGMDYLKGMPEKVSYVFNEKTTALTQMLFLYRLKEPLTVQDGSRRAEIFYCGMALNMNLLNPYFNCEAYGGNSSTYVVDTQGLKLFSGANNMAQLKGFNVFKVLRGMEYLHNSTFDSTLQQMEENGLSYSNAVLDGKEYYYALYKMENSQWILVFMVPSGMVAVNTVELVSTTTRLLMIFAVFMAIGCGLLIFLILRIQQQRALRIAGRANALLAASNRELEQAQATTNEALRAAEAASRAKTDFLANMSHDIRTPMNAIVGITRLMAHDKNDPAKIDAYIGKVQQSSQHLLSLINDVLDMSKIESGEITLNSEAISLADQIGQVESIMRPQIEDREQDFTVRIYNITHEHLIGDAVRLRQVFINLLSNAVKYTPNGGSIRLELEEQPCDRVGYAMFRIAVADTGYGMAPEFVQHIYEPFTRAENSTTNRVQGTGLGMAITKKIIDLAGGTISIQSQVDQGSCFTVNLPFLIDRETKTQLPVRRVLLISDEELLVHNARAAFRESETTLLVAQSQPQAQKLLRQAPVDVVLLGSCLQGDTLEANIQRVRREAKDALLIFCCEYQQREQLAGIAEQGGVDGVLVRPFFLSTLARAIDRAGRKNTEEPPEEHSVLSGMRFLCAEDNTLNAEILQAVLDMNGASCVIYPNGKALVEAFAQVKEGDYDAILMDVQMPVMNGLDATRALRRSANPLGKTIPIIAMTANAFSEDVQNCLNAGMDAHVSKPLDISTLERTVKSLLDGKFSGGGHLSTSRRRRK